MPVSVLVTSESELSPSQEAEWLSDLPPARRARIGSWTLRRDRHRSLLASRLLLEHLRRLGHPRNALATLRYPQRGRPTLELPLAFSLSHCDGRIAAAVSTEGPVGIDVEKIEPLQAGDFELYLNAAERRWAGASARRFCMIWTRKRWRRRPARPGWRACRRSTRAKPQITPSSPAAAGGPCRWTWAPATSPMSRAPSAATSG
jgi:phosphopantetheinyl transferase